MRGEDAPILLVYGDLVLRECPLGLITGDSWAMLEMWEGCHNIMPTETGVALQQWAWPWGEGMMKQPFYVIQAFRVITSEWYAIQEEKRPRGDKLSKK